MYVVVEHAIHDPEVALLRGNRLITGEGAPEGTHVLQFYPARDGSKVVCLWESTSPQAVQDYADTVLGSSSTNHCFEVDAGKAFAVLPLGVAATATPVP